MADLIYARIVGSRIRSQLAYPRSFALDVFAQALVQAGELVVIIAVFGHVDALGGFTRDEVLLIFALSGIAFGLADMLVGQLDELPTWIRTGTFDVLLVRPLSTFLQLLTSDVQLRRLGRVLVSSAVLVAGLVQGGVAATPLVVALLVVTPLTGAVIIGAIWIATCATSFWIVEGRELANSFTYGSTITTAYPITVFAPWLRTLFCFVVPGAFVAYYPALAILDRPDPLGLPAVLPYLTPLVAVVAVGVAALVWRAGVRHYTGTGS
ncbi:ABC transporter permease [Pseudonocardia sp. CA-107938]|uniref:ABC transporter permease n=1 Tax=Pseudonocardia sp. CA-107938 TaxID=3240021 RepID=UPI003D89ECA3